MTGYSWHPTRDEYGIVLGPHDGTHGYPMECSGITFADACDRFGAVTIGGELRITIDRPDR